eukprot:UN25635
MKSVDVGTDLAITRVLDGEAVGQNVVLGAAEDGVDYAPCHDACASEGGPVTTAMTQKVEDAKALMKDNNLETGVDMTTGDLDIQLEGCPAHSELLVMELDYPDNCRDSAHEYQMNVSLVITGGAHPEHGTFNYLAIEGAKDSCNAGNDNWKCCLQVDVPESETDYLCEMEYAAVESDLTIGVGFAHAPATEAAANAYPNRNFAAIDVAFTYGGENADSRANLEGILFREDQSGYLAGILAGKMTTQRKIGVVAGKDFTPVKAFVNGFKQGVASVCATCHVRAEYSPKTGGFQNEDNWGVLMAQTFLQEKRDIIFGVGGWTGSAAIKYAVLEPGTSFTAVTSATGDEATIVKGFDT